MLPKCRLSEATLASRTAGVAAPAYDRGQLKSGIVHLGLGAFFRAHGAAYTDTVLAGGDRSWGITGVSLQRSGQRDRLQPQDGLFTLIERQGDRKTARIIGSVLNVLVAPENPAAVIARMAHPDTAIVSLTVTEKGYCLDPATGRLNANHLDIAYDLVHPDAPRSAPGFLVAGLRQRYAAGLPPFTVLCCDNLPHNGRLVRRLVTDLARLRDPVLADWIEQNGAFPCTMVDRIVPAGTQQELADAEALTGLTDASPAAHEPFTQWVIEDTFADRRRPRWELAGAQFVADVAPFETMKLRLLNGAHSALAYLGYLGGHETIGQCVADPVYRQYVRRLWNEEIIPVTPPPPGTDLGAYADQLLLRFENTAIRHRTWQIAMDGSQKLPQRLLATIRLRLEQGLPVDRLALAVAAWMRYVGGIDENGGAIDVRDPLAAVLASALDQAGTDAGARVAALLRVEAVFDPATAGNPAFQRAVTDAYDNLYKHGARASMQRLAF